MLIIGRKNVFHSQASKQAKPLVWCAGGATLGSIYNAKPGSDSVGGPR